MAHCRNVGFALRHANEFRRVGEVTREGAHGLRVRLAVGMEEALVGILRQQAGERGGRGDAWLAQRDVGGLRRRSGGARLGTELLADEAEDARAFGLVKALALTPPAVEFEPALHDVSSGMCRGE